MTMTRRDYEMVANTLWDLTPVFASDAEVCRHTTLIGEFAERFAADNPRFDAGRFIETATGGEK